MDGMAEKFADNTYTISYSTPVRTANNSDRSVFNSRFSISDNPCSSNVFFNLCWNISLLLIARKFDKGLRSIEMQRNFLLIPFLEPWTSFISPLVVALSGLLGAQEKVRLTIRANKLNYFDSSLMVCSPWQNG